MKVRDLIDKTAKYRQGHLLILFFTDLDKEIKDVIKENEGWNQQYVDHLRRIMKELNIKEDDDMDIIKPNTVEFMGSGKDVVDLMKKTLCNFENIFIEEAVLISPDKSIEDGTAVLSLLINIPNEKKWVSIYYTHEEIGHGSITYQEHDYQEQPFPKHVIERSRGRKYAWRNEILTEEEILDIILERKRCKITIDVPIDKIKHLTEEDILNLQEAFKHFILRIENSMEDAEKNVDIQSPNFKINAELKVTIPRLKEKYLKTFDEMYAFHKAEGKPLRIVPIKDKGYIAFAYRQIDTDIKVDIELF